VLASGETLVLHVAGQGGVPVSGATAVAVNITAMNGGPLGYLAVWPTDEPQPFTAQMVYAPGQIIGNAAMAKLAPDGTIAIFAASGPVHLIVDITGYFLNQVPTATYTYDGDGLRATKTVGSSTAVFTWDRSSATPKLLDDGTNAYVYGADGLPLEQVARDRTVTWFHHDQLGSTRSLTNAAGAVVGTATYDPYGKPITPSGLRSPLGFAGEYTDAETGFAYLRARYYDPGTGQFLSRDPLVALTGSAYGYVGGEPAERFRPVWYG
jgi:RHS repeat-associated protein